MTTQCLQKSTDEADSALLRALFKVLPEYTTDGSECTFFISGNSAALFHLRCLERQKGQLFPAELMQFLEKEFEKHISFGVRNFETLQNLRFFFQSHDFLTPEFEILEVQNALQKGANLGLNALAFSLTIIDLERKREVNLKFYCKSWFSAPSFDSVFTFHFDNESFGMAQNAIRLQSKEGSPLWLLNREDLLLLKLFTSIAPVTRKISVHNQLIVDTLRKGGFPQKTKTTPLRFKQKLTQKEQKNDRSDRLKLLGFDEKQLGYLRKAYRFVNELFNELHSKRNIYHNIWHTDFVLTYSIDILANYFPQYPHMLEVTLASIFHDCNLGLDPQRIASVLNKHMKSPDQEEISELCEQINVSSSPEEVAGKIGAFFCEQELAMNSESSKLIVSFVRHTQLGQILEISEGGEDRLELIGKAVLQMADLYQIAMGDFDLFLKNNFHLMFELNGEPHTWHKNTGDMLEQLLFCLETDTFHNPLFNLSIFQFEFEGKEVFRAKLIEGLKINRELWAKFGLAKCLEWKRERRDLVLMHYPP
jgi:hypothetical protein